MPTKTEISEFSLLIETLAASLKCSRLDAILEHCKNTGMEIEIASSLISTALKSRIREEAEEMNLLKKTCRLPL